MTLFELPEVTLGIADLLAILIILGWIVWFSTRMYYFHYFYETLKSKGLLESWNEKKD